MREDCFLTLDERNYSVRSGCLYGIDYLDRLNHSLALFLSASDCACERSSQLARLRSEDGCSEN